MLEHVHKNKLLKIVSILLILLIIVSLAFAIFAFAKTKGEEVIQDKVVAQNIILLIGDGMGFEQVRAGHLNNDNEPLTMETLPYKGSVNTNAYLNLIPTDSAAAATALATGNKVVHYTVAMSGEGNPLKSITEYSREAGKRTGIIATKDITDATPAAFSAHSPNRSNTETIIDSQLDSNIDVIMGQGKSSYDPHAELLATKGYSYVNTKADLEACNTQKIFAMFDSVTPESEHSLSFLTQKAISTLSNNNDKGFFLMVEGSKIDSMGHSNDMDGLLKELKAFDEAVATALQFAAADKNTLVIVVADHETGDLILPENVTKESLSDDMFHSGTHTAKKVPYFAYGPTADGFLPDIENTEIFVYMMNAFGLEITEPRETGYFVFPE